MKEHGFSSLHVSKIYFDAHRTFHNDDHQEGIAKIDALLSDATALSQWECEFLHSTREVWIKASDESYVLPEKPSKSDVQALFIRSADYRKQGNYKDAMSCSWSAFQHSSPGTLIFMYALFDVIEISDDLSDVNMARSATELFLSHYDLIVSACTWPFTPVGIDKPSLQHEWNRREGYKRILLPWRTALKYIDEDAAVCWARVLVVQIELSDGHKEALQYADMISALRRYYIRTGDIGGKEFLAAYT